MEMGHTPINAVEMVCMISPPVAVAAFTGAAIPMPIRFARATPSCL